MAPPAVGAALRLAARRLRTAVEGLTFGPPVVCVYNPLRYAWEPHQAYLGRFGATRKRVLFLGMNPGPFGMVQTGVPFGEIAAVRDWLGIRAPLRPPPLQHPRRPVQGFACARSEVSGRRLWGLFAQRFGDAGSFFSDHFVANYCPLAFVERSGANRTPEKLTVSEQAGLFAACDAHLLAVVGILQPEWLIGIGGFAARQAERVCAGSQVRIGQILHPSPANPAANRDWAGAATRQLQTLGVWRGGA